MDNRIALRKNMQIVLMPFRSENSGDMSAKPKIARTFYIEKEIERGSSAICYEAYYLDDNNNKVSGSLKEFYPLDFEFPSFDLERDEAIDEQHRNQLYSHKGTLDNFLSFKDGYIRPYIELNVVRNEASEYPKAKDINRYLPVCDLYQGTAPDGTDPKNCTVYVWVKNEPGLVTFKQVLKEVCGRMHDGNYNRAKDLSLVLNCVSVLAKAVDTLHLFGLYHLDLKPENFGIKTFRGEADDDVGISLYDINSLYSGRERDTVVMSSGTKYFRSPEVARCCTELFGPASDVYSLGAILYYAIVIGLKENEKTKKEEYVNIHFCEDKKEFDVEEYNNIGVNLRNSVFLGDTDETGNSIIFGQLYALLQKSLNIISYNNENGFYETAAEFNDDLKKIIVQLKKAEGIDAVNSDTKYYVESLYKTKENYYAEQSKNGATGVLQWLLYKYPLYDYCTHRENEEDGCNVLVLGGATYASKFIDLAFELSQVKNCRLDVTVVSKDADDDRSTYLVTRPALSKFIEIDGEKAEDVPEDPYGKLSFVKKSLNLKNQVLLQKELRKICGEKNYTYVFVSLGEEKKSITAANACAKVLETGEAKKLVSYIVFDKNKHTDMMEEAKGVTTLQLSVFDSIDKHKEYDMLRRMAFNAHLTWANNYINDIPTEKAKFRSKYNFNSSLGNALSIKYKLHSVEADVGVKFDFSDPVVLASQVVKLVGLPGTDSKGNIQVIRELTMYEHRRWIVEKVTNSWQPLTDLSQLHTDTKDKASRRHPCIVPAGDAFSLYQKEWKSADAWATATDKQKESLDCLDRLSVDMHQHFVREAEKIKSNRRDLDYQLSVLRKITAQDSLAACVSVDIQNCVETLITNGSHSSASDVDRFSYYKRLLLGIKFSETDDKKLSAALKKIEAILFPIIQASKKKNWKNIDENFIRNIPFVLTYSTSLHLCVPFFSETSGNRDTTRIFGNVAAALMLNPLNVTYIVDGDVALNDIDAFKRSLEYCVNTIKNHRLQTSINVVILRKDIYKLKSEDREAIIKISDKIHLVDELVYSGWNQVKALKSYLTQKSTKFTAIELNKTGIGGLLQSANELSVGSGDDSTNEGLFPMYTFDSATQSFETTMRCDFFRYVNNHPHLLVDDLFYSRGKTVNFSEPELISEYNKLWALYNGAIDGERNKSTAAWKNLCSAIKAHMENTSRIAKFPVFFKDDDADKYERNYSIVFPAFCKKSVQLIVDKLYRAGFANTKNRFFTAEPSITRVDSKSCKFSVDGFRKDLVPEFEKMLINPFRLAEEGMIEVIHKPTTIEVFAFNLRVENMKLPSNQLDRCKALLDKFSDKEYGYIRSCSYSQDNCVSFTFATENHMHLFRNEGNILELHVYRKAIESGVFDDVKNGATVFWNTIGTSNELDVIMVSGFKTFIVECKATIDLCAEFYDKLYPLNNTFGVNNIPIIVADLNGKVSPGNRMQISRGEELGIKTITNANDPVKAMKKMKLVSD